MAGHYGRAQVRALLRGVTEIQGGLGVHGIGQVLLGMAERRGLPAHGPLGEVLRHGRVSVVELREKGKGADQGPESMAMAMVIKMQISKRA